MARVEERSDGPAGCERPGGHGEAFVSVVHLPTVLRSHAGGEKTVSVDGSTVGEVLSALVATYPGMNGQLLNDDGTLHKFVNVYLNDDDVRYLSSLATPVGSTDEVSILPAVASGSDAGGSHLA